MIPSSASSARCTRYTGHQLRQAFTGPYAIAPRLQRDGEHQETLPHLPTTSGALPTNATGALSAISTAPGTTLVSPHPAPVSIRTGSSMSRQHHKTPGPSLDSEDIRRRDPTLHVLLDDVPSLEEPLAQPPTAPLEPAISSTAQASGNRGFDPPNSRKMIFTDLYKSPRSPLSRLRPANHPVLAPGADFDVDLISKDKARQKEAVKRHLKAKIRNDWAFTWPPEAPNAVASEANSVECRDEAGSEEVEGYLEVASYNPDSSHEVLAVEEPALDSGEEADSDSEAESVYSIVSEDPLHWKPRLDWTSELSEDELPYNSPSPFRYDNPDSIGRAVLASKIARKARRRRERRKEMAWNNGLACFEARRNAWTGAKVARVRPKPTSPVSPLSPRRGFFWRTHTHNSSNAGQTATSPSSTLPLTPTTSQPDAAQLPSAGSECDRSTPTYGLSPKTSRSDSQKASELFPVETLLPIPPPLLPPANPMRASINPSLYNSIYEKVVVHSLQPSCPINLGDMIRACVSGWKRDGEWPPRPAAPEPAAVVAVKRRKNTVSAQGRRLSFSFLSSRSYEDKDGTRRESATGLDDGSGNSGTGKALRRSLQKVLGLGHNPTITNGGDGHAGAQQLEKL